MHFYVGQTQKFTPSVIPDYSAAEEALLPAVATTNPLPSSSSSSPLTATTPSYSQAPAVVSIPVAAAAPTSSHSNLLDFGDDFTTVVSPSSPPAQQYAPQAPLLILDASVELSPQKFQQLWLSLPDSVNGRVFGVNQVPSATQQLEQALRQNKVLLISSVLFPIP